MSILAAILLIAAPPQGAPPVAGDGTATIVVTGEKLTHDQARKRAREFIRRTGVAESDPIARWIVPVCPRALKVDAAVAQIVEQRVRDVAAAAGARVAPPGCAANITIVFTADGGGFARAMIKKSPPMFAELSPVARDRTLDGDDAIRWWYSTREQSRDGLPVIGGVLRHYNSSVVSTQVVRALRSAMVVVDVEKANGTSLDAVASFAAMVAMAEMEANPPAPADSILALFEGEAERRDLSAQDAALLRAIYSVPPDREADQHRRRLVTAISKDGE